MLKYSLFFYLQYFSFICDHFFFKELYVIKSAPLYFHHICPVIEKKYNGAYLKHTAKFLF